MSEANSVTFQQLLSIYRALLWSPSGTEGVLRLRTSELKETLAFLLRAENLDDSGLSILGADPDSLSLGQIVHLRIESPRIGLGILVRSVDKLSGIRHCPGFENKRYFVIPMDGHPSRVDGGQQLDW